MQAGRRLTESGKRFRGGIPCTGSIRRRHRRPGQVTVAVQQEAGGTSHIDDNFAGLQVGRILGMLGGTKDRQLQNADPRLVVQ